MAVTNDFKTYERGTRYQTTQAVFTSGMYFTDTPIPESTAKVLVNYDAHIDGMSLVPRRGLQTTAHAYNTEENYPVYAIPKIITCKECYNNNKIYIQIIVKKEHPTDVTKQCLGVYTVESGTETLLECWENETGSFITGTIKKETKEYAIHNLKCENTADLPGCFIGDRYFFFDRDTGALMYTVFNDEKQQYIFKELPPYETTASMAQQLGFNMLLTNPYTYTDAFISGDSTVNTITMHSINAFEDAACTIPAQELIQNQTYYYRFAYSGKGTLSLTYDWSPVDNIDWQVLKTESITINANLPKIVVPFKAVTDKVILRCTASRATSDVSVLEPVDVMYHSFEYSTTQTQTAKTLSNFSLHTATAITYWQNRLVVAGVTEDKSYLFVSAPELFEYFPFPNNADYLDEPIIAVEAFLDDMLVFTKSKLYLYSLDAATGTYTRKCIQTNLNIMEEEAHLIKIVKNMAYFKSGNYYYMVVPKLNSTTGDLTIAPVYRFVKTFFDNFNKNVHDVLKETYDISEELPLKNIHNYLDYESIHNVYMFLYEKDDKKVYINFDMLYNTVKRTWSIYVYDSCSQISVYKQDATKPGRMLCLSNMEHHTIKNGVPYYYISDVVQFIDWDTHCKDSHYTALMQNGKLDTTNAVVFNNVQYLDTGLIDLNSNIKKRFREIQFRVLNTNGSALYFNTTYFIDGNTRVPAFIYEPIADNATGTLTLNKTLVSANLNNSLLKKSIKLGSWTLSKDVFPGADVIKIRVPVSGKGYNPQIKISCSNQEDYALLDLTNVYRQLYSR